MIRIKRFFRKVRKTNSCWEWTGAVAGNNKYGAFWDGEKVVRAHRFSYEIHKGMLQEGKIIMHSCDNPVCVNPDHLSVGTQSENMKDCAAKGRRKPGLVIVKKLKSERIKSKNCIRGHELTDENKSSYFCKTKNRVVEVCLMCKRENSIVSSKKWRERIKNGEEKSS